MKISLIHPSRGRAKKSCDNINNWLGKASRFIDIEVFLSLDKTDSSANDYVAEYKTRNPSDNITIVKYENDCVVAATNNAVKHSEGSVLVYVSDDFDCPEKWDLKIAERMQLDLPQLLKVDDCLQPFDVKVLTIPIMNRKLYERLGYFWHPEYKSMFVDEHLYHITAKNGWLTFAPELKFEHKHVCVGKAEDDETYRASARNWDQGKALFEKHKREGFPL